MDHIVGISKTGITIWTENVLYYFPFIESDK